jgi:hypothetical protein
MYVEPIHIGRVDPSPFHLHHLAHLARCPRKRYQTITLDNTVDMANWVEQVFSQYEPMDNETITLLVILPCSNLPHLPKVGLMLLEGKGEMRQVNTHHRPYIQNSPL